MRGITTKANLEYLGLNLIEGRSYNGTVTEALTSQRSKIDHAEVDFSEMLRTLVEKNWHGIIRRCMKLNGIIRH